MPQLDILIFQYENLNFVIGFFLLFFLNQYYVFPTILRNIVLRRKLITRDLTSADFVLFSSLLLKRLKIHSFDNVLFRTKVSSINEFVMEFYNSIVYFFMTFKFVKINVFKFYFSLFREKLNLIIWLNYSK